MTSSMTIMPGGMSRRPPRCFTPAGHSGARRAGGRMQALNIAIASQLIQPAAAGLASPDEDTIV